MYAEAHGGNVDRGKEGMGEVGDGVRIVLDREALSWAMLSQWNLKGYISLPLPASLFGHSPFPHLPPFLSPSNPVFHHFTRRTLQPPKDHDPPRHPDATPISQTQYSSLK